MMETESLLPESSPRGGFKSNWRLMRYHRLGGGGGGGIRPAGKAAKKKMLKMVRLRGTRRYWRIRAIPKLKLVVRSPLKLLNKIKNAYIEFMLKLSGKVGGGLGSINDGGNAFGQKRIPKARQVTHRFSMNEFEARLIYEISKVLTASRELNPTV